ncbi:hypothetical protein [Cellulomonas sp.]|uniref:PIN-like domain-containing protein n=1 Tax=Cellulomonas sp. TaxID=40001 RepID=UPI002D6A4FD7|nr:hypothetical protein [Cellulomonas sp.]HYQ76183.1 hypothetical protein [Cellulomonas sp.]
MRQVYIDENLSPGLVPPLSAVYRRDVQFRSWQQENQGGALDLDLIPYLGDRGFDLIVTKDHAQIDINPAERAALATAGLSWVGVPELDERGARLIAEQLAVVLPAIGAIMHSWPSQPTAYRLASRGSVFESQEPL